MAITQVVGVVERVVFERQNSTVFLFLPDESGDLGRQVGEIKGAIRCLYEGEVVPGDSLMLTGRFYPNPRYGWQFKVSRLRKIMPVTPDAIREYLASGVIPMIGRGIADQLVDRFGAETLSVMEGNPIRLTTIPGIGEQRARAISDHVKAIRASIGRFNELLELGVTAETAALLDARLGDYALMQVRSSPYRVIGAYPVFDFRQADRVAGNLQCREDQADARLQSMLLCSVHEVERRSGQFAFPLTVVLKEVAKLDAQAVPAVEYAVKEGRWDDQITLLKSDQGGCFVARAAQVGWARDLSLEIEGRAMVETAVNELLGGALSSDRNVPDILKHLPIGAIQSDYLVAEFVAGVQVGYWLFDFVQACRVVDAGFSVRLLSVSGAGLAELQQAVPGYPAQTVRQALIPDGDNKPLSEDLVVVYDAQSLSQRQLAQLLKRVSPRTHVLYLGLAGGHRRGAKEESVFTYLRGSAKERSALIDLSDTAYKRHHTGMVPVGRALTQGDALPVEVTDTDALAVAVANGAPLVSYWVESDVQARTELQSVVERLVGIHGPHNVIVLSWRSYGELGAQSLADLLADHFVPAETDYDIPYVQGRATPIGERLVLKRSLSSSQWKPGDLGIVTHIDREARRVSIALSSGDQTIVSYAELAKTSPAWVVFPGRRSAKPVSIAILMLSEGDDRLTRNAIIKSAMFAADTLVVMGSKRAWQEGLGRTPAEDSWPALLELVERMD